MRMCYCVLTQELQRERAQMELLQLSRTKTSDTTQQDQRQAKSVTLYTCILWDMHQ